MRQTFNDDYRIPVLIRIEPERLKMQLGENADVVEHLGELLKRGLRGSLKTGNRSLVHCMLISISIQIRLQ